MAKNKFRRYIRYKIIAAANEGATKWLNQTYTLSQQRVPLDDGELSLDARVFTNGATSEHFEGAISYGNAGVAVEYAVIQHENMEYRHRQGEQAKYLESAVIEMQPELENYIGYTIRGVL
jgi:hypothetical protein